MSSPSSSPSPMSIAGAINPIGNVMFPAASMGGIPSAEAGDVPPLQGGKEEEAIITKPRASNPRHFHAAVPPESSRPSIKHTNQEGGGPTIPRAPFLRRPIRFPNRSSSSALPGKTRTVADFLASQGQRTVAKSACVRIDNISPTSSLEAMVAGMREALGRHGILNLDAPWDPTLTAVFDDRGSATHNRPESADTPSLPSLPVFNLDEDFPNDSWILEARVILSPFARPTGWYVRLANRSLVHALLSAAHESPLACASRNVKVRPAALREIDNVLPEFGEHSDSDSGNSHSHSGSARRQQQQQRGRSYDSAARTDSLGMDQEQSRLHRQLLDVTDATLRIENCSEKTSLIKLVNLFSRYDLRQIPPWKSSRSPTGPRLLPPSGSTTIESTCIVPWTGRTSDGKVPPTTWLVHFRNASWARAALRELQGVSLDGRALLLAQYPQQITNDNDEDGDANGKSGGVLRQGTSTDSAAAM